MIIACRDEEKAKEAVTSINATAKNQNTTFMKLDLTSYQSIRDFVGTFNQSKPSLLSFVNYTILHNGNSSCKVVCSILHVF